MTYDVEGIYVGYRYYETAAAEGYIDYDETVQFPFGFGLSYTSFDWEVVSSKFGDTHGEIEIQVKVTNVGDKAGKDVVELYYTAPYYRDRNIEKSAKVLGAFAKTKTLKPGESETLTLSMPVDNISSYDYLGERCYVADEGTYAFNLQTDSHNIKVNADGKTLASDVDGPAGISSANLNYYGNEYTSEPLMAATWNIELIREVGESVGREAMVAGVNGWYAPGADTHRTPFNGRCGEYFSEDPLLSGKMAAAEVAGAQSKGLYVYLKHFVCNDNDLNRGGMYTWINEQELREIQLGAFEYAVKEEDCSGLVMAYNRVGPCECSVSYGLNTTVLQNEWGYRGASITDGYSAAIGCDKYEHPDLQLRAGAGMLLYTGILVLICFWASGALGGGKTETKQAVALPDVVSDFSFDFESGEYAFSDVSNAKNYNIRIFEANPSEDNADMPVAARRVRDSEGAERYTESLLRDLAAALG